jgi:hypothetical protein
VIPIGAALGDAAADHLGLRTPFLFGAALLAVAGAIGLRHLRTARLAQARATATQASGSCGGALKMSTARLSE